MVPPPLISLSCLTLTFISCVTASKSLTSLSINFSSIKQWVVGWRKHKVRMKALKDK